jgi:hypothetical protein
MENMSGLTPYYKCDTCGEIVLISNAVRHTIEHGLPSSGETVQIGVTVAAPKAVPEDSDTTGGE